MRESRETKRMWMLGALAAVLLAGLLAAAPAHALTAAQCAALTGLSVPSTTITSATVVPAGGGLPEYCRVKGHVDAGVNFEMRLQPTTRHSTFSPEGGGRFVGS